MTNFVGVFLYVRIAGVWGDGSTTSVFEKGTRSKVLTISEGVLHPTVLKQRKETSDGYL